MKTFLSSFGVSKMGKYALLGATIAASVACNAEAPKEPYVAGKDYTVLTSPGTPEKAGMVEVREFFWYGCPHCYRLEPYVAAWRKTKPKDVNFVPTPAAMNPVWEQNARGYYAAQMLGLEDKTHEVLFKTINEGRQQLFNQNSLANFYAGYGADKAKFNALFNSFIVSGKIAQSKALATQYQLEGVPALVVNGKYVVQGEDGRSLKVVDYLVAKERKSKVKAK